MSSRKAQAGGPTMPGTLAAAGVGGGALATPPLAPRSFRPEGDSMKDLSPEAVTAAVEALVEKHGTAGVEDHSIDVERRIAKAIDDALEALTVATYAEKAYVLARADRHVPQGRYLRSTFGKDCYSKVYSPAFDWRKRQVAAGLLEKGREIR
jgi:hypothetical protein